MLLWDVLARSSAVLVVAALDRTPRCAADPRPCATRSGRAAWPAPWRSRRSRGSCRPGTCPCCRPWRPRPNRRQPSPQPPTSRSNRHRPCRSWRRAPRRACFQGPVPRGREGSVPDRRAGSVTPPRAPGAGRRARRDRRWGKPDGNPGAPPAATPGTTRAASPPSSCPGPPCCSASGRSGTLLLLGRLRHRQPRDVPGAADPGDRRRRRGSPPRAAWRGSPASRARSSCGPSRSPCRWPPATCGRPSPCRPRPTPGPTSA